MAIDDSYTVTVNPRPDTIKGRFCLSHAPTAIGVLHSIGEQGTFSLTGAFMPSYIRYMAFRGMIATDLFWQFCTSCPLYHQQACSGGAPLIARGRNARRRSANFVNAEGRTQTWDYVEDNCKMNYTATERAGRTNITIPDHFAAINDGRFAWFAAEYIRNEFRFTPLRMFNTYESGNVCLGENRLRSNASLPEVYETFLNGTVNNDLRPLAASRHSKTTLEWCQTFNLEELKEEDDYPERTITQLPCLSTTNSRRLFHVLPPNVAFVTYLRLSSPNEYVDLSPEEKQPRIYRERLYVAIAAMYDPLGEDREAYTYVYVHNPTKIVEDAELLNRVQYEAGRSS
jgi:hypothetical protein